MRKCTRSSLLGLPTVAVFLSLASTASVHVDDFSSNTLDQYEAVVLFDSGSSGNSVDLTWDGLTQQAQVSLQGGYATSVMTTEVGSLIGASQDFIFSVYVSVEQEYVASIYFGDLDPGSSSTYLRFNFDTFSGTDIGFAGYVNGVQVEDSAFMTGGSATNGTLEMRRLGSDLSFSLNGDLLFQTSNPGFSNQALHYGVANQITSGPSSLTSRNKFDNWNFLPVPEPTTASLLALGLLGLAAARSHGTRGHRL